MVFDPRSLASSVLPDVVKERTYYTYHEKLADLKHNRVSCSLPQTPDAPDHLLIVVVDALRPDFVPDLPVKFDHVITPATWTFPSVTSLHTGLRPSDHGAVAHTHPADDEYAMPAQTKSHPHFPRDLEAAGYETYAGCGFTTPFLSLRSWYQTHRYHADAPAAEVVSAYRAWRRNRSRTAAYLHLGDLHAPVAPPAEYVAHRDVDTDLPKLGCIHRYRTDFDGDEPDHQYYRDHKLRLHRAALDYVSDHVRSLLDDVRDDTLVVVTGDHGEGLWEYQDLDRRMTDSRPNYCFGHGGTPFDVIARVPLAVSAPSDTPVPRGGWASLRDVPATLLDSCVEDRQCPGYSWHDPIPADRPVICEATRYGVERKAAYRKGYKLIRSRSDKITLTAKLTDNGEVFGDIPAPIEKELLSALPEKWDDMDTRATVSEGTQERLESLGYR
jgi:arylsulfatase A-like enzyme